LPIAHAAGNRLIVEAVHVLLRRNAESRGFAAKQGEFASRDVGTYLLDYAVMIDASAIQRLSDSFGRYRKRISRAPHPAGVVQGAVKFGIGIRFWSFSHPHTFYSICTAFSSSIAALVGKTLPAPGGNPRANFKAVPLPEISAWIALLCEEGHTSGSSLDAHFRKL
jgi:hypothetical protein